MDFAKEKQEFLARTDKSRKGSIDTPILDLVTKINVRNEYYTTSSCSGRVLVIEHHPSQRKDKMNWLFASHELVETIQPFEMPTNEVWFRMEPAILHVACNTIEAAQSLLTKAQEAGFKRSGILTIGKSRVIVELISTEKIETIVGKEGKWLIDKNYLAILIEKSNQKLKRTWEKIEKLSKNLPSS